MLTRLLDRWLLLAAYLILVFVTAWNAWNTDRVLDRIEEDVCAAIEVTLFDTVVGLDVVGEVEGVDRDDLLASLNLIVELTEAVEERCGSIFLDEIDFSD